MPVWAADFFGAFLRWALGVFAGALVVRGIIPKEIADAFVAGMVPQVLAWAIVLSPLALSWFQKWKARKIKLLALEMKPGTSEKELDDEVKRTISKHVPPAAMLVLVALALSAATIAASGCRSFTLPASASGIVNAKQAAKAVVILGETYETSMGIIVELRRAGHVTDAQWAMIDDAQREVNRYGPQLVTAVEMWQRFGTRSGFDTNYDAMKGAVDSVVRVQIEVQR